MTDLEIEKAIEKIIKENNNKLVRYLNLMKKIKIFLSFTNQMKKEIILKCWRRKMKKKVKDCTKKQIFEAIYNKSQTSIGDNNCEYCKLCDANCQIRCNKEYETCIYYGDIIDDVGEEEIEVEEDE